MFLFDTDPGGPATTIYTGSLVSMLTADGTFEILSHTGSSVDVCALLGG